MPLVALEAHPSRGRIRGTERAEGVGELGPDRAQLGARPVRAGLDDADFDAAFEPLELFREALETEPGAAPTRRGAMSGPMSRMTCNFAGRSSGMNNSALSTPATDGSC